MPVQSTHSRLQDELNLGLSCLRDLWSYQARSWVTSVYAADIDQDGDIEVLAGSRDGRVHVLTRDGRLLWDAVVGTKSWISSVVGFSLPLDQQGARILVGARDGRLYALDKEGYPLTGPAQVTSRVQSDAIQLPSRVDSWYNTRQAILQLHANPASPYNLVFGSEDRCAYGFDTSTGQVRWRFPTRGHVGAVFTADIDGDGQLETLVGSGDHTLSVLDASGTLILQRQLGLPITTLFATDLDHDGAVEILVGTRARALLVFDARLQEKWTVPLSSRPLTLCVADINNDQRSEILIPSDDSQFLILDDTGKALWHQDFGTRLYSLFALDLDRDGHTEILAGTEDARICALRIQLIRDLEKKIRRSYTALGKPKPEQLLDLTTRQRDLLRDLLGIHTPAFTKELQIQNAERLLAEGQYATALPLLVKLEQQKVQLFWEKEQRRYLSTLCLPAFSGEQKQTVVVGTPDGLLSAFSSSGRLLWSRQAPGERIIDMQSGYLFGSRHHDLAFLLASGTLWLLQNNQKREFQLFPFAKPIACFSLLASSRSVAGELLIGTADGTVALYTQDLQTPILTLDLSVGVRIVYATAPFAGLYRSPELLVATSSNQICAFTRSGKQLWMFEVYNHVLALCARDLDGDGRLEILVGSEDRNMYLLDNQGHLIWRYFLPDSVLALEVIDLDGDGRLEVLAGCANGMLYVFQYTGDLIWRYKARDCIQALRVADIDADGNSEIILVSEDRLELLQLLPQERLSALIDECWSSLLEKPISLETLRPFLQSTDPALQATAFVKVTTLQPFPPEAFALMAEAVDAERMIFTEVRKVLPRAVMLAYPTNPTFARTLLERLFVDPERDVRVEVVEHLQMLAAYDWQAMLSYLTRALESSDLSTCRAAVRKVDHVLQGVPQEQAETLFTLLLETIQNSKSDWIKQEAGKVMAHFFTAYPQALLPSLPPLLASSVHTDILKDTLIYNLESPLIRQVFTHLLALCHELDEASTLDNLRALVRALENGRGLLHDSVFWLIYRELLRLFSLSTLEELASSQAHLAPEVFQISQTLHTAREARHFLQILGRLETVTRPINIYLRRDDLTDRLNSLLDGINALESLQHFVDQTYQATPFPGLNQRRMPEFAIVKVLLTRWQRLFHAQLNELRGYPELACELQSRQVHEEETVGLWLLLQNTGRASANNLKVTLLSSEGFKVVRSAFETDAIFAHQEMVAEFLLRPLNSPLNLTFEISYDDSEGNAHSFLFRDCLTVIEWQREFVPIANPYSTGTPAQSRQMFYGREQELAYLQDNLTRTTAQTVLIFYGQRRSGKTTLLYQLTRTMLLAGHVPVMIDLQAIAYDLTIATLVFRIANAIFKAMQKKALAVPEPRREQFLSDPTFALSCFLEEVEVSLQGRKLIMLVDEFEILEEKVTLGQLHRDIFLYLRSLLQRHQFIHFLFSGTHHITQLTRDYWSIFFNIALHYRLPSRIAPEGATALITQPVAGELEYDPLAVIKIRQLTADQPYLLHLVCRTLVDHCNLRRKNYVALHDVNLVLRDVMDTGAVHFDWLWNQIGAPEQLLLSVIAEGCKDEGRPVSLKEMQNLYRQHGFSYDHEKLLDALKTLWDADVIESSESAQLDSILDTAYYQISIGLLRQWLRREKALPSLSFPGDLFAPGAPQALDAPFLENTSTQASEPSREREPEQ